MGETRMKKNQEGFSVVEGLLIVVIVGMLGGVGWYVWHSQQQVDKTYSQTSNSSVAPKKVSAQPKTQSTSPAPVVPVEEVSSSTFSKIPADLQAAIISVFKKEVPNCVKADGQINDSPDKRVDYDTLGFAGTGIGCYGGGSWGIFAKVSGNWQFLAKTQFGFDCSLLNQYHYPRKLLALNTPEVKCLDASGNDVPYSG
jgi:hypothetical protein